jgi:glycerate 2-kinase
MNYRKILHDMFTAAIDVAKPARCVPPNLPDRPKGRIIVVGAGKASAAMARAVEQHWGGDLTGLVVTRYGHAVACETIEIVEASHPVPDAAGEAAARRILGMVRNLTPDDLVLCLMSGGGSALMTLPAPGLTLADKQALNQALLRSGATITEMNCVRKHISAIKGGRLATAAAPARVVSLMISDVPGDDPAVIASGPTVPDPTSLSDAQAILEKYGITEPQGVLDVLAQDSSETPKPGVAWMARSETIMVATPQASLEAAATVARNNGLTPLILGDAIEGEAREVAQVMAGITRQSVRHGQPVARPAVLLSGGETTVTMRGQGRGGRNAEFLLALAIALEGTIALEGVSANVFALAGDTDGIDGSEDNAGAVITPDTLARAAAAGLDAKQFLANNDGYSFFEGLGDLVMTGPTLTNVNDFRAIIIGG